MKWNIIIVRATVVILVLVFAYTGIAKLWGYESSLKGFLNQPLPDIWARRMAVVIPVLELTTVSLLIAPATRRTGLALALVLMTAFTTYTGLVWTGAFDRVPCSCGGIFSSMDWSTHLVINTVLTGITGLILLMPARMHQPP